jgi:hypothetical protein
MGVRWVAKCALFIDYENVFKSLQGRNMNLAHRQLAELFKAEASKVGEVIYARAYAPWDIWPDAMSAFDRQDIKPEYVEGGHKDNADLVMSLQIQDFLHIWRAFGREEADTFILVTGDAGFVHVIKKLQEENKRVIVWGVEGSISNRLTARVPELVNIQQLLQENGLLPAMTPIASAGEETPDSEAKSETVDLRLRGLVLLCERIMLERGWVQVPFLTLQEQLSASHFYGENLPQCRSLIMTGLDLEMLETKKQPNPKRPGTETTFVLLRKEHEAVAQTLRVTHGLIAAMRHLVARLGRPAVSISTLLAGLNDSPELNAADLAEVDGASWIDLMVEQSILRRTRGEGGEPYVTLNERHPLVEQVVPGEDLWPTIVRLILILDHYLTRTGYIWMSMGLLRQQLGSVGQREMERAVRSAIERGLIVVRQQSNQYGARPTTGAYLQHGNEQVQAVLAQRNRVLDQLLQLYGETDVLSRLAVVQVLMAVIGEANASDWLEILLSHQLLTRAALADGTEGLAINRQHPVVARRAAQVV